MAVGEHIPLTIEKVTQGKTYTLFVLSADQTKFAIYAEPQVAGRIQDTITNEPKARPSTLDLLNALINGLDVSIEKIVIDDFEEPVFFAKLFLKQGGDDKEKILEIDARPSDCFTLSMMNQTPLYCRRELLDKVIPYQE